MTPVSLRAGILAMIFSAHGAMLSAQATGATATASNQSPTPQDSRAWTFRFAAAGYFLPDDEDYLQPAITADRGGLHLEGRYNYEERRSLSAFAGWTFTFEKRFRLDITPMFGLVGGDRDGVIPALEVSFTAGPFEFYSEGEYVIDAHDTDDSFLYNWSEVSVWPAEWLRFGLVTQRTRVFNEPRDVQRGVLGGISIGRFEVSAYWFNPGSADRYFVTSAAWRF